jgi:HSP20 family protein
LGRQIFFVKGDNIMELTPWRHRRTLREMEPFRREMDRLWDQLLGEPLEGEALGVGWYPPLDISETKECLTVEAELPGMEVKDIDIKLTGDILTIKGEKKVERKKEGKHYHCCECHIGNFQRSMRLPVGVKTDKIDASFDKGILTVKLPKMEEALEKEIKINVH